MQTLQKVVAGAEKLHQMKITETEFAFCLYVFLIKQARRLHSNPRKFDYLYKNLFNDLKVHYDRSFSDTALCFGNLMLAIELINVSFFDFILIEQFCPGSEAFRR